jgi:hypothetical protein
MKSYAFCPVTPKVVNERVARLNAAFTTLIIVLFLVTTNIFLMVFLAFDFLVRAFDYPAYSPLAITSKGLIKTLEVRPQMINAGPKIFAARIGVLFSLAVVMLFFFEALVGLYILASVLLLFSILEAVFGLCVACKIYPFVYRYIVR